MKQVYEGLFDCGYMPKPNAQIPVRYWDSTSGGKEHANMVRLLPQEYRHWDGCVRYGSWTDHDVTSGSDAGGWHQDGSGTMWMAIWASIIPTEVRVVQHPKFCRSEFGCGAPDRHHDMAWEFVLQPEHVYLMQNSGFVHRTPRSANDGSRLFLRISFCAY